jgi:hypothetical protein
VRLTIPKAAVVSSATSGSPGTRPATLARGAPVPSFVLQNEVDDIATAVPVPSARIPRASTQEKQIPSDSAGNRANAVSARLAHMATGVANAATTRILPFPLAGSRASLLSSQAMAISDAGGPVRSISDTLVGQETQGRNGDSPLGPGFTDSPLFNVRHHSR